MITLILILRILYVLPTASSSFENINFNPICKNLNAHIIIIQNIMLIIEFKMSPVMGHYK